jgi:hypothetical protein
MPDCIFRNAHAVIPHNPQAQILPAMIVLIGDLFHIFRRNCEKDLFISLLEACKSGVGLRILHPISSPGHQIANNHGREDFMEGTLSQGAQRPGRCA